MTNKQSIATRDAARGYTDADMTALMDHPEATDTQLAAARPFADIFPIQAAAPRFQKVLEQAASDLATR